MDRIFSELKMTSGDAAPEDYEAITLEIHRFLRAGGTFGWVDWCNRSPAERVAMVRAGEMIAAENIATLQEALGVKTRMTEAEYSESLARRTREMLGEGT